MKILFVNTHMKIGGISTSLYNWLQFLAQKNNNHEVETVIFNKDYSDKFSKITQDFKIINPKGGNFLFYNLNNKQSLIGKIFFHFFYKINLINFLKKKYCLLTDFKQSYDIAISYSNDIPASNFNLMCNDFVEMCVNAKYKVAWIHNDIEKLGITREYALNRYQKFDAIVNVSESCKLQFDALVPEYTYKSFVISNPIDVSFIKNLSLENIDVKFCDESLNLVTVARIFNEQKRIDRILEIVKLLIADDLDFHWYIVGDGEDLEWLKSKSTEMNLNKHITFLGFKINPYSYIKAADFFVLTSDYEAQGMVITESLLLGTPVITTNFEAAYEFIQEGVNGYILPKDPHRFYIILKDFILCKKKIKFEPIVYSQYQSDFEILLKHLEN